MGLVSPADFARELSTVTSSGLHSWVGIAICWIFPPTTASRCVSARDNSVSAQCENWYCKSISCGNAECPVHSVTFECSILTCDSLFYCFIGGGHCLPDSQRTNQGTVSEHPCRSLEFKKAGGLL